MLSVIPPAIDVVSPKIYDLILDSASLCSRLLPGGLIGSPYEILDYRATLVLPDPKGQRAIFQRTQQIRFLQDGVSALLDHFWGDGVILTDYQNTAGSIGDSFKDAGVRHLVIDLERAMGRGEMLTFDVERTAMVGFTTSEEWLETSFDHPIGNIVQRIIFPRERPCQRAELVIDDQILPITPSTMPDGRTLLEIRVPQPKADTPHTIRWHW
jgi:hypothetical protein